MGLLRIKPYSKITVTELCRLADINRGTFYIHYFDVDDVLDDIVTESFSDVSQTIGHVLCPQKETCTYPFCQKVQENKELWPLFMDHKTTGGQKQGRLCQLSDAAQRFDL